MDETKKTSVSLSQIKGGMAIHATQGKIFYSSLSHPITLEGNITFIIISNRPKPIENLKQDFFL